MPPPFILGLKNILDRNDKSELVPHLENSVRIIISWSEWRYSNHQQKLRKDCLFNATIKTCANLCVNCFQNNYLPYPQLPPIFYAWCADIRS